MSDDNENRVKELGHGQELLHNKVELLENRFAGVELSVAELSIAGQQPEDPKYDKLFTALAKAQAEIKNAEQDREVDAGQYKYSYATLDSVLNAIRGPLSKNGLCLLQMPRYETVDKSVLLTLETILGHSSGQSMTDYFSMFPPKQDPQGIGSCLTYMRRYTAMAMVGIAGAADDDAEATKAAPKTITAAEADKILSLADDLFGDDADALIARMCDKIFGVAGVPQIPEGEGDIALQRIQNTRDRKDKEKLNPKPKPAAEGEDVSQTPADEKPKPKSTPSA
jgi:hypothetical protein